MLQTLMSLLYMPGPLHAQLLNDLLKFIRERFLGLPLDSHFNLFRCALDVLTEIASHFPNDVHESTRRATTLSLCQFIYRCLKASTTRSHTNTADSSLYLSSAQEPPPIVVITEASYTALGQWILSDSLNCEWGKSWIYADREVVGSVIEILVRGIEATNSSDDEALNLTSSQPTTDAPIFSASGSMSSDYMRKTKRGKSLAYSTLTGTVSNSSSWFQPISSSITSATSSTTASVILKNSSPAPITAGSPIENTQTTSTPALPQSQSLHHWRIHSISEYLLHRLMSHHLRPLSTPISTQVSNLNLLHPYKHFILDRKSVVAMAECFNESTGTPFLNAVVRNEFGAYNWRFELDYGRRADSLTPTSSTTRDVDVKEEDSSSSAATNQCCDSNDKGEESEVGDRTMPQVGRASFALCSSNSTHPPTSSPAMPTFKLLAESVLLVEEMNGLIDESLKRAIIASTHPPTSTSIIQAIEPPALSFTATSPPPNHHEHLARIFLAHWNLLMPENRHRLISLRDSTSALAIHKLDSIPTRECVSCSVLFVCNGSNSIDSMLDPDQSLPPAFCALLDALGSPMDPSTFCGWRGNYSYISSHYASLLYWSDRSRELIFHVPYLLHPPKPPLDTFKVFPSPCDTSMVFSPPSDTSMVFSPPSDSSHPLLTSSLSSSFQATAPDTAVLTTTTQSSEFSDCNQMHANLGGASSPQQLNCVDARSLVQDDIVTIAWMENIGEVDAFIRLFALEFPMKANSGAVLLLIHPFSHLKEIYLIRIVVDGGFGAGKDLVRHFYAFYAFLQDFGPLLDEMVVSQVQLGDLLRRTAMNAHFSTVNHLRHLSTASSHRLPPPSSSVPLDTPSATSSVDSSGSLKHPINVKNVHSAPTPAPPLPTEPQPTDSQYSGAFFPPPSSHHHRPHLIRRQHISQMCHETSNADRFFDDFIVQSTHNV